MLGQSRGKALLSRGLQTRGKNHSVQHARSQARGGGAPPARPLRRAYRPPACSRTDLKGRRRKRGPQVEREVRETSSGRLRVSPLGRLQSALGDRRDPGAAGTPGACDAADFLLSSGVTTVHPKGPHLLEGAEIPWGGGRPRGGPSCPVCVCLEPPTMKDKQSQGRSWRGGAGCILT